MLFKTLIKTFTLAAFGLLVFVGTSNFANAQMNRQDRREQQKIEKQQRQVQERQAKVEDRRIKLDQRREQLRIRNMRNQKVMTQNNRYRVFRNGNYYETTNRGADLLRQGVNSGYQEGYRVGRNDRYNRRTSNYNNSSVYRKGNYGYQNYVNSGQYQYYFQQGFQRGYDDGFNNRYENGSNNSGSINILGTILQSILSFEQF